MDNAVVFLLGIVACIGFLMVLVVIMDIADNLSHKKFERIVEEYERKLEQQKEDNAEHTRKCLAEQKEQIESVGRKAREYQSARFEEERVRLANENFEVGKEQGKKEVMDKVKDMIKAGDMVITRRGK